MGCGDVEAYAAHGRRGHPAGCAVPAVLGRRDGASPRVSPQRGAMSRATVVLIIVASVIVIAGAAGAGLWHVSASPRFCNSCHIMRPYVDAWKVSKHSVVSCVQCHYPSGLSDTLRVNYKDINKVDTWAMVPFSIY